MTDIVTTQDLYIIYGDDEYLAGVVTDANGNVVDLTQNGIELTFKLSASNGGSVLLTKTIANAGVLVDAAGNYTVHILDTDKASIALDTTYVYSVRMTETNADLVTVARGNIRVVGTANG